MIETKPLEDIISLALWTAYLEDEQPQSLIFLSEVEEGKSALTSQFADNDGIVFPHDVTAYGIIRDYKEQLVDGKLKHLIFPEFVFPLARQKETVHTLLSFLNGLMEEGIREIHTYATKLVLPYPVKAGIIACLAKDEFEWRKSYWVSIGFLSRFLPVSYSYSEGVEEAIFQSIFKSEKSLRNIKWHFHEGKVTLPPSIATKLRPLAKKAVADMKKRKSGKSEDIIEEDKTRLAGYRAQKGFQRLIKACALNRGRHEVTMSDFHKVEELSYFINLKYNKVLSKGE